MDRPPIVSFLFFASVLVFFAIGAWESRRSESNAIESATNKIMTRHDRILQMSRTALPQAQFHYTFNALDPSASELLAATSIFDPDDEYFGLPDTNGRELVAAYCASCHSLRIVMQQQANETRWNQMLTWMTEKQGMPELPKEERRIVIKYLSENFGAE